MLLKFGVEDFIDDRVFQNITVASISSYQQILRDFTSYCNYIGVLNVEEVTTATVKSYLTHCIHERKNVTTTVNTKIQRLRAFFNYMIQSHVIKENPATGVKKGKEDIKIEVFSDYHIKQMLSYYRRLQQRDKALYAYRDYTIIIFLYSTGARLGELCNLRWQDIDFDNYTIAIFGKGRKLQNMPVTRKLLKELSAYKLFNERYFAKLNEYVFTNRKNERLTEEAVKNIFKRLKGIMNFRDVRLSAHTFRHTFAHRCLMAGMDVFTLQKLMRHSSLITTQKYLALWGNDLKEQNEKYNPLNELDI